VTITDPPPNLRISCHCPPKLLPKIQFNTEDENWSGHTNVF